MITFKAKFISSCYIKERIAQDKYKDKEVAFVEINPLSKKDLTALKDSAKDWHPSRFASAIYGEASFIYFWDNDNTTKKFYALTEQKDNFKNLNPYKILGIAETETYSDVLEEISYLQVKPEFINKNFPSKYKHIGSAMLTNLKNIFTGKNILLDAVGETIPFYIKNGFQRVTDTCYKMMIKK